MPLEICDVMKLHVSLTSRLYTLRYPSMGSLRKFFLKWVAEQKILRSPALAKH